MINTIQIKTIVALSCAALFLIGCERQSERQSVADFSGPIAPVEAITPPPDFFRGDSVAAGSLLVVRVDPNLNDGRGVAVVLLRGYGGQKNVLFTLCAHRSFVENQNDLFLIGKIGADVSCPGVSLLSGAILRREDQCFTEPNRDPVFSLAEENAIGKECEIFSVSSLKKQLIGGCKYSQESLLFDRTGLVRCAKSMGSSK